MVCPGDVGKAWGALVPACLPEPRISEVREIFEVDLSVKIEIGYVAVSTRHYAVVQLLIGGFQLLQDQHFRNTFLNIIHLPFLCRIAFQQ